MNPPLNELENNLDHVTKQIILNLIDKKMKYLKYKKVHFILLLISITFSFVTFYYFYHSAVNQSFSMLDFLMILSRQKYFMILLFIGFSLFGSVKIFSEKMASSEKEFHDLRCEIIDKSGDLWPGEQWDIRHNIFALLKSKYNINLYHQSK